MEVVLVKPYPSVVSGIYMPGRVNPLRPLLGYGMSDLYHVTMALTFMWST